jgi:hypothetical protein
LKSLIFPFIGCSGLGDSGQVVGNSETELRRWFKMQNDLTFGFEIDRFRGACFVFGWSATRES